MRCHVIWSGMVNKSILEQSHRIQQVFVCAKLKPTTNKTVKKIVKYLTYKMLFVILKMAPGNIMSCHIFLVFF